MYNCWWWCFNIKTVLCLTLWHQCRSPLRCRCQMQRRRCTWKDRKLGNSRSYTLPTICGWHYYVVHKTTLSAKHHDKWLTHNPRHNGRMPDPTSPQHQRWWEPWWSTWRQWSRRDPWRILELKTAFTIKGNNAFQKHFGFLKVFQICCEF